MIEIKEIAHKELPPIITGSYGIEYDINEVKRDGFILGANFVLEEIEKVLDSSDRGLLYNAIKHKIKELKR